MKTAAALTLLLISNKIVLGQAQYEFGDVSTKDFEITSCPIDSSAAAFYILDFGLTRVGAANAVEFINHVRIKILKKSAFDRADVSIPFSSGDRITRFKASTFNIENGEIIENKITRKEALIEKESDSQRRFNFTFPNVKEGSILEYSYAVNQGSWRRLNTWYFQSSIPAMVSHYSLRVPSYLNYQRLMTGYVQLADASIEIETSGKGTLQVHNYIAKNVPSFEREPYTGAPNDYISKIDFELKSSTIPGQAARTFMEDSYASLSKSLYESEYWHSKIEKSSFAKDKVTELQAEDSLEFAKSIFNYVRDNFKKDYDVDYETLKKVFAEKKGGARDINMVLAAMLNEAGFNVNLVLLSTRSNGKLNMQFPIMRKFNYTTVKVDINGVTYLLDPSSEELPFGVLPSFCLNGKGLVISEGEQWVDLKPYKVNGMTLGGNFTVSEDGIVKGELRIKRQGYRAWDFIETVEEEGKDDYIEEYNEGKDNWIIEDHSIGDLEKEYIVNQTIAVEMEDKVDDLDDILYLNPILTSQLEENPFKSEERLYPVDFGSSFSVTHYYKFTVDESFIIDEVPKAQSIALPNNAGKLLYNVTENANEVTVTCRYQIKKTEFSPDEYPYIREFYSQLVEKQGEQIVLRRK